ALVNRRAHPEVPLERAIGAEGGPVEEGMGAVERRQIQLAAAYLACGITMVAGLGEEGAGDGIAPLLELADRGLPAAVVAEERDRPAAGHARRSGLRPRE